MEVSEKILERIVGFFILMALLYGMWHGAIWLYNYMSELTPARLALFCITVTGIPFVFLIVLGVTGENEPMQIAGMLTMASLSFITIPGLAVSSVWYLIQAVA